MCIRDRAYADPIIGKVLRQSHGIRQLSIRERWRCAVAVNENEAVLALQLERRRASMREQQDGLKWKIEQEAQKVLKDYLQGLGVC